MPGHRVGSVRQRQLPTGHRRFADFTGPHQVAEEQVSGLVDALVQFLRIDIHMALGVDGQREQGGAFEQDRLDESADT